MRTLKTLLLRYGVAVLAPVFVCLVIWAIRLLLRLDFPGEVSVPSFLLAIVFSAWFGIRPGLLAAGVSLLALHYYFISIYSLDPQWQAIPIVAVFLLAPVFVGILNESRRQAEVAVRKSEAEMLAARAIQQRLFPVAFPQSPEFDIAGICHPVDPTGGDYFDFIPMQHGQIGIVVADVSGHGIASALIMVQVRAYLQPWFGLTTTSARS